MTFDSLEAISPVDGRYFQIVKELKNFFSEHSLFKYRLIVEIEYFIALTELPLPELNDFDKKKYKSLRNLYLSFNLTETKKIKNIEAITKHDIKALEYYIKEKFDELNLSKYKEFVHFGLTSQDINNTAIPLSVKECVQNYLLKIIDDIIKKLKQMAFKWKDITILARTHGQAASPTLLGKEFYVFVERLENQIKLIKQIPFSAKFGGATGNFNAHLVAYPNIDWINFANNFINKKLGLKRLTFTTQIEHYDNISALFDAFKRINNILLDLARDCWLYISYDYFKQKIDKNSVGSSAMPHKVNPIDFENAEGNIGISNALFTFMSSKLPVSRLQRDLSDSTVLRNIGVAFAHSLIAYKSIIKGLDKLILNKSKIDEDLENNWEVLAEAIQTILRKEGVENPYELLKSLTRKNKKISNLNFKKIVEELPVTDNIKRKLLKLSPLKYTGINLLKNSSLF